MTASINVGNVSLTDNNSHFVPSVDSLWIDYDISNHYEKDKHIYMMGITSPNGFQKASVAFTKLTSSTLLWICDWTASRSNKPPDIPNPITSDSNWVLLDVLPETSNIIIGPDGATQIYRISGRYIYGHKNPSANVFDNVTYPRVPWIDTSFDAVRGQPNNTFTKDLSEVTAPAKKTPISIKDLERES